MRTYCEKGHKLKNSAMNQGKWDIKYRDIMYLCTYNWRWKSCSCLD